MMPAIMTTPTMPQAVLVLTVARKSVSTEVWSLAAFTVKV